MWFCINIATVIRLPERCETDFVQTYQLGINSRCERHDVSSHDKNMLLFWNCIPLVVLWESLWYSATFKWVYLPLVVAVNYLREKLCIVLKLVPYLELQLALSYSYQILTVNQNFSIMNACWTFIICAGFRCSCSAINETKVWQFCLNLLSLFVRDDGKNQRLARIFSHKNLLSLVVDESPYPLFGSDVSKTASV